MNTETLQRHQLNPQLLPAQALFGNQESLGWELSAEPFCLSQRQYHDILHFGEVLWRFLQSVEVMYRESVKGRMPGWIAEVLDRGKPESLTKYAAMKRFKSHLPLVIRPDLLITESGWALCEIDAVPGGLGFTAALNQAYRESGFRVIEAEETLPLAFLKMLKAQVPGVENPVIAVVLSDEAADYRAEMSWLVAQIQPHHPEFYLIHPSQVDLVRDHLAFTTPEGEEKKIDLIYRFFELFDLANIPKIELIQYAVKKGWVQCTPPFKPYTEEKSVLAMLHHPVLESFWREQLGEADFHWFKQFVPQGWILDPAPLPPQAVIPNLLRRGAPVQGFQELADLSQKERALVVKPSGFSPLAWGSRGVTVGHDVSQEVWGEQLNAALASYDNTPYLIQRFEKPTVTEVTRFKNMETLETEPFRVRTRLCPYYFIQGERPVLAGILATSCPQDKKVIHGMKDAVLAPCLQP